MKLVPSFMTEAMKTDTNTRAENIRISKMEDTKTSTERLARNTSNFSLFPAASNEGRVENKKQSIFPSAATSADSLPNQNSADLDWLKNKSYTEDTERKLVIFQQELQQYQNKQCGIHADADSSPPKEEERAVDKKRQYSSSGQSSDETNDTKRKKKKKHKHKKKHIKEKHQESGIRDAPRQNEKQELLSKKIFLEELDDIALPMVYRIDRCSDQNSWTYGSLYKPHIARYKHFSPFCLGSGGSKQVLLYDIKKSSKHKPWHSRYFGKDNRHFLKYVGEPVNTLKERDCLLDNYVELKQSNEALDKKVTDIRQRILDESTSAYIKGQTAKELFHSDTDTEHVKGPLERKVEEFNRKLREDPTNIELWLKFLKFQDILFSEDDFRQDPFSKEAEKAIKLGSKALLDKKISILDKAFESNPASIELHLTKLDLCTELWEPTRINKELEQLLFVHPANVALWNYYLGYNQSRLSIFTVSRVSKLYHKCFKTLFGILEGKVQTHSVPDDLSSKVLEIFIRYCFFLKETGYKEKALTSIQALLEFNIFCPSSLKSASRETKMAAFEEFWESGCGKLGFPGGQGWKHLVQHKEQSNQQSTPSTDSLEDFEEEIIEKKLPKNDTWLQIETLREAHHWLPWQPDLSKNQNEEDCEDPERLVMFDDISPILHTVPTALYFWLVYLLLTLCGMSWTKCKILAVKSFCGKSIFKSLNLSDIIGRREFSFKGSFEASAENLNNFITLMLEHIIKELQGEGKTILTLILIEFHMQRLGHGKQELSKSDKKELRKTVKNLLKAEHNRNNLVVWSAYVTIERLIGKSGEADTILETALTMHSGKDISVINEETVGLLSLYRIYCEAVLKFKLCDIDKLWEKQEYVCKGDMQKIIQILFFAIENRKFSTGKLEAVSSTTQLKIRAKFKKLIDGAVTKISLSEENTFQRTDYLYFLELCICSGLFEYCSVGLDSSLSVCQSARSLLQRSHQGADVDLFRAEIRLILYHMACVSTPLKVLRNCLDTALSQHPDEADFLKLFVDVEKRSRITGRLNRHFDKFTRNLTSPVPALIAVWSQQEYLVRIRQQELGDNDSGLSQSGIVHKTRSWLERSLSQSNGQHSPLLWKLYFILEKLYGDSSRLKGIFYRSLQQCPWVKELYLEGIHMFGNQLQELVDMMTEKEIRVQIPVEELDILMSE